MTRIDVAQFSRRAYPGAFSIEQVFHDIEAALPDDIAVRAVRNQGFSRGLLPRLRDALGARRHRGMVNHVLGDVHYLTLFLPRKRTILTIHDCEMIHRASGLKRFILWLFWIRLPVARAGTVVAISQTTRADIEALLGGGDYRIEVIENPVSPRFSPTPPPPAGDSLPEILHIGTKANKNLDRLIDAATGLPLKLVVIGRLTEAQRARIQASGLAWENRHDLSADEIVEAYRRATLLAFVSLSEGFGLPIIEAQATRRPVLCADREPMRCVAGDGALLVDPEDTAAIRSGLERLLGDPDLRARLVAAGRGNVTRFTAGTIAEKYAALYRKVAEQ
jgi:glycosyltransferase involved in cell wall biosynthesis